MAFSDLDPDQEAPLTEINMIPMIDVMLVLLIIFIITAPLLTHSVKVELPQARSQPHQAPPQKVDLAIDAEGQVFWEGEAVDSDDLAQRMAARSHDQPPPEILLRADQRVPYRAVARVMGEAARQGLVRIGFATDPGQPAANQP